MTDFDRDQNTPVVVVEAAQPDTGLKVVGDLDQNAPVVVVVPGLLPRLLNIANGYRVAGDLRQASDIYFTLVEEHPQTPEAARAWVLLLQIGEEYERQGETRQARSLYERLF
jgi:hypothetical protein